MVIKTFCVNLAAKLKRMSNAYDALSLGLEVSRGLINGFSGVNIKWEVCAT